jgi:hypothetical protein
MDTNFVTGLNMIDPVDKRMAARGGGAIVDRGYGRKLANLTHLAGG